MTNHNSLIIETISFDLSWLIFQVNRLLPLLNDWQSQGLAVRLYKGQAGGEAYENIFYVTGWEVQGCRSPGRTLCFQRGCEAQTGGQAAWSPGLTPGMDSLCPWQPLKAGLGSHSDYDQLEKFFM